MIFAIATLAVHHGSAIKTMLTTQETGRAAEQLARPSRLFV
jgi:hypothetical protein